MQLILQNEATAALRTVNLFLVESGTGLNPATGEGGGTAQVLLPGATAYIDTAILTSANTLGQYRIVLPQGSLATLGPSRVRYKGGTAAEAFADILVVAWNPFTDYIGTVGTLVLYTGTVGTIQNLIGTVGTVNYVGSVGTLNTYLGTVGTVGTALVLAPSQSGVTIGTLLAYTGTVGTVGTVLVYTGTIGTVQTLIGSVGTVLRLSGTAVTDVWGAATKALTDKAGFSLAADQSLVTIGTLNTYTGTIGTLLTYLGTIGTVGIVVRLGGTAVTDVWGAATKALTDKAGFSLAADQSAVTIGTVNTVPAIGSVGTVGTLGAQALADVNAQVDTALSDIYLNKLLAVTAGTALPGTAQALLYDLLETASGTWRFNVNALSQGPSGSGGVADWTANERNQIRYRLGVDGSTATPGTNLPNLGTVTASLVANQAGVTIGTLNTYLGTVSIVGSVLAVGDKTGYSLLADQSAVTIGTVNRAGSLAVNLDKSSYSLAASQVGVTIGTVLYTGSVGTVLDKAGYSLAADQSAVTVGTAKVAGTLGVQAKADVNAEMIDVLTVDTIAEPGVGAPQVTPTPFQVWGWFYADWRNQVTQTGTLRRIRNDAGSVLAQATLEDTGTTFTKSEYTSG